MRERRGERWRGEVRGRDGERREAKQFMKNKEKKNQKRRKR